MPAERLSPRERWLAVLNHELPDRVPLDYWATPEATARLLDHLGCAGRAEMLQRLHVDAPVSVGPAYVGPPIAEDADLYGCRFKRVDYGGGAYRECVAHPLAEFTSVEQVEAAYEWPSPDWFDYSVIPSQLKGREHLPVSGGGSEPFLTYKNLRGQEQAFMDLALHPRLVHHCLDRLFEFCYERTRRTCEQ
ncbi:MAG: uroporphyrinogen decarboxylase/cobalamine-independent methonine synthase family protein, partial [Planctomycetota bacterium]